MNLNEKINSIPIETIKHIVETNLKLSKVWAWLYDINWHDWLKFDENKGIITDFSGKYFNNIEDSIDTGNGRTAKIIWIIEYIFNFNKSQAIKWLEDNKIIIKEKELNKEKNEFTKKFYGSKSNNFWKLKEYLEKRAISFEKVEHEVGFYDNINNLLLLWRNLTNDVINLHKRNIDTKGFFKESNAENNYFFLKDFDINKETIAVEWDIDYLSLIQFRSSFEDYNIIWVPGVYQFKHLFEFIKEKNVFVIWDNDDTEKTLIAQINGQKNIKIINSFLKAEKLKDTNDFVKKYWEKIIETINNEIDLLKLKELSSENKIKKDNKEDKYVFIKSVARYYWLKKDVFYKTEDMLSCLLVSKDKLKEMRYSKVIETYDDMVYKYGWEENCFNLLNEDSIIKSNNKPIIHPYFKLLIDNVCGYNKENITWLQRAILYKYKNINSYNIPGVIIYWTWWSWKWLLIKLLSSIFWEENTLENLSYQDLTNTFDVYEWNKLIVEYGEVGTYNTQKDKQILNKLKNKICQEKITVQRKQIQPFQRDNLAWFFISSNDNKPIQLDSKEKWNRRFTVIKSKRALTSEEGKEIYNTIQNKNFVSSFIAWLEKEYLEEISNPKFEMKALENQEKIDLENRALSDIDNFWLEIKDKHAIWDKITIETIKNELDVFADLIWESIFDLEKYLWNNSPFVKKKISIDWKKYYGIIIE